jgi:hypothetical protein
MRSRRMDVCTREVLGLIPDRHCLAPVLAHPRRISVVDGIWGGMHRTLHVMYGALSFMGHRRGASEDVVSRWCAGYVESDGLPVCTVSPL